MSEAGVDISHYRSKHLNEVKNIPFDWVITVCDSASESCPVFPGKAQRYHVGFDDPPKLAKNAKTEEEALGHYRRVRDEIRLFIESLPTSYKERRLMDSNKENPASASCGPECSCNAKRGMSLQVKIILFIGIVAVAGAVLASSLMKKSRTTGPVKTPNEYAVTASQLSASSVVTEKIPQFQMSRTRRPFRLNLYHRSPP